MPEINNRLESKIIDTEAEITAFKESWLQLLKTSGRHTFYHHPAWFLGYIRYLQDEETKPFLVGVYDMNRLVAVFPLTQRKVKLYGFEMDAITLPMHNHMPLGDIIIDDEYATNTHLLGSLVNQLKQHYRWDILLLQDTIESSYASEITRNTKNMSCRSYITDHSYGIHCKKTFDESVEHVSGHFKRNLARLERKAIKDQPLEFYSYQYDDTRADDIFNEFIDIEDDSWKGDNNSSIKSKNHLIEYYRYIYKHLHHPFCPRINILKYGDTYIAAQFGIMIEDVLNLLKIGFRSDYGKYGPGNIILSKTLKHYVDQYSIKMINIVTSPAWAEKWKNYSENVYTHYFFRTTLKGTFIAFILMNKPCLSNIKRFINKFNIHFTASEKGK